MSRKRITNRKDIPKYIGYDTNEEPYYLMVDWLTDEKTPEEAQKIVADFEESHTYLLIAEYGAWSPVMPRLIKIYEGEQKRGLQVL